VEESVTTVSFSEAVAIGTTVAFTNVSDGDCKETLRAAIVAGSTSPPSFETAIVDSQVVLRTISALDRELIDVHLLTVRISDGGTPPLTTTWTVNATILDANDNAPEFQQPAISANMLETTTPGTTIATLSASDVDIGVNQQLTFSLESGGDGNFVVDGTTGEIRLQNAVCSHDQSIYTLTVGVRDNGTPQQVGSNATVTITVLNVNDFPPVFTDGASISTTVFENTTVQTSLLNLSVTDQDCGDVETILFSIAAGNTVPPTFHIDNRTGTLSLVQALDFEMQRRHVLSVVASDGVHTDTISVVVNVADLNDNAPQFSCVAYFVIVGEL
jgi:hypothetical protein